MSWLTLLWPLRALLLILGERFGEGVLSAFSFIHRRASVTSSDHRDYLTVIFALAAAEEYSHRRQLLQSLRKGESKRIFGRTEFANAEGEAQVMLDYEFLKEYSWSLAKLIQYVAMALNITKTASLS
jgi:hypothetical protein